MELKQVLFIILGISLGAILLIVLSQVLFGSKLKSREAALLPRQLMNTRTSVKQLGVVFLQHSYQTFMRTPLLHSYCKKVRKRLSVQPVSEEYSLRMRTAAAVYFLLLSFIASISLLFWMNPDPVYLLGLLISAVVIQGLILDAYVNKQHRVVLSQLTDLLSEVRHAYHRHGMIDEAIYEASEEAGKEVAGHGYKLYEILNSPSPQQSLEVYYETEPGRYLKSFAGISYLTMEYGDRQTESGSAFLKAISGLTKEIHLDILRLKKLDYLLKGLNIIALIPLFFTKPIEHWAKVNFPLTNTFYTGRFGLLTKIGIYLLILICYVLLQKLKSEDEGVEFRREAGNLEKRLLRTPMFRRLLLPLIPSSFSAAYKRTEELIRNTGLKMKVEWFFIRRMICFAVCFVICLVTFAGLHFVIRSNLLHTPSAGQTLFGSMTQEERSRAAEQTRQDRQVMEQLHMSDHAGEEAIEEAIREEDASQGAKLNEADIKKAVTRIQTKLATWHAEELKWWEPVAALFLSFVAYFIPYWLLLFQKRVRLMDMKHEIYQFYTLVSILKEMERVSVEEMLEWLESFAVIFKNPIQKCLLHFEYGPEIAMAELKEETKIPEFTRIIDKFILSVSKIPVRKAFDDLENEMGFQFEQRKQDYEKTLDTKAHLGKMIGFAPMYALVFMYLVIPLIWMSFTQMTVYYQQIQTI